MLSYVLYLSFYASNTSRGLMSREVNLLDFQVRFESSDFFINSFYLWWTSFYYLPAAFTLFVLGVLFYNVQSAFRLLILVLPFFLLPTFDIVDYWSLNTNYISYINASSEINILLTNSINKYHPFLFYVAVSIAILLTVRTLIPNYYSTLVVKNQHTLPELNYQGMNTLTFTLFLGAWWAYQEGS
jgi:hypothetical protein